MANPILRGFSKVMQFSGRDTGSQFWPYAAIVILLVFIATGGLMSVMTNAIFQDMAAFAAEHPEAATVQSSPGHYSIQVDASHPEAPAPDFGLFLKGFPALALIAVLFLAAAVSRRLHDRNLRAYWGLMPVPFLAFSMIGFPRMMSEMMTGGDPNMTMFFALFFNNVIYVALLAVLIVLLVGASTVGPNRFGSLDS